MTTRAPVVPKTSPAKQNRQKVEVCNLQRATNTILAYTCDNFDKYKKTTKSKLKASQRLKVVEGGAAEMCTKRKRRVFTRLLYSALRQSANTNTITKMKTQRQKYTNIETNNIDMWSQKYTSTIPKDIEKNTPIPY